MPLKGYCHGTSEHVFSSHHDMGHVDMETTSGNDLTAELQQAIIEVVRAEVRTAFRLASYEDREFLTIREAMVALNMSRSEIYRRFKARDLTLVKRGRRSLICAKEVAAFAERLRGAACNAGAPK